MRRGSAGGAGSARNAADERNAGGGWELFRPWRNSNKPAPAFVREECADSRCQWRGAGGVWTRDAANGALHEALPAAGIRDPSIWIAGCGSGGREIDRSRIHEGGSGTVALSCCRIYFVKAIYRGKRT